MTQENGEIVTQLTPAQCVGLTIYGEARGGSPALRAAIASVIWNRLAWGHPAWGLTPAAICLAHGQFSCWSPTGGAANYAAVMNVARLLVRGIALPSFLNLRACLALGAAVVAGTHDDTVHGATFYYSPAAMVPRTRVPSWAVGREPVAVISGTKFYAREP